MNPEAGENMKLRKTITPAVIAANRQNATRSTGPQSERGKQMSSQNAGKLWIFSKNLKLDEDQQTAFNILFKKLRRSLENPDDPLGILAAEVLATEYFRFAKSTKLDARLYASHSPGNEALEAASKSELLDLSCVGSGNSSDWQVEEVNLTSTKGIESENKNGTLAIGNARDRQLSAYAKFVNPVPGVLRAQSAAERRFFRALREYRKFQKRPRRNTRNR